jgi:3',5'-cyclic AMP phosphodiesterase CpdA
MPVYPLVGNHDRRAAFREVFAKVPADAAGFVQYGITHAGRRFVMLDTLDEGSHKGTLDAARLTELDRILRTDPTAPHYLFLHHPPMPVGMPSSDPMALDDPQFASILARSGNVRHIFFGHLHRAVSGVWNGIPFSGIPGVSHQVALDLRDNGGRVRGSHEPPSYSVVTLRGDDVVIHQCHFLDTSDTFDL